MKKITFIFLFLCSISFGQNLGNPAIIGQTNRNQKVGKGLQVTDTLITDGVVILKNLATFGSGVDTGVGFKNGKIVRFLNTGGGGSQTLSISNDTLSISNGNSVVLPIYFQSDSATITSYDVLNSQNAPPISPNTGDTYLVGTSPSGAWVGHAKDIAEWNGSSWDFTDGVQGNFLYNATTALTYIFRSNNWVQTTGIPALNNGNTISTGVRLGTNNLKSLTFETNNVARGRIDSIGRFYFYDTSLRNSNKFLQIDSATGRLIASAISANSGASALFPNGLAIIETSRDFQSSDEGKLLVLFPNVNLTMPNALVFTEKYKTIGIMRLDTTSWFEQEFGGTKIKSLTTPEFKHNEIVLCFTSVTDDDSASRLLFTSTTIIEEETALKHLYDKSQNAIPLSGTEVGSPVTGDIDFANANIIFNNIDGDKFIKFGFNTATDETGLYFDNGLDPQTRFSIYNGDIQCYMPNGSNISFSNIGLGLDDNGNPLYRGVIGAADYTANITDLDYTQKKYVGFRGTATLSSGTVTVTTDKIKTGYKIYLSVNTPSGTQGFLSAPTGSIVNEISFVINSSSVLDNSTVNWWITP